MKNIIFIIFFTLCGLYCRAYDEIHFRTLDVKSGISDNYISDILHDKYGFMWFATRNGLNRYDGYHFKHYSTTQLGTYDNSIEWVSEDASGTIWIKTPVNYCFYDREADELKNNVQSKLEGLGIRSHFKQLFIDEENNLWCVATDTLYYYQFSKRELSQIPLSHNIEITDLSARRSYAYLLLNDGSVITIDWVSNTTQKVINTKSYVGLSSHIYIDKELRLWLYATHGYDIKCYSTKDKQWLHFPGQEELYNNHCNITTVTDDGKDNVWIGTDNNGIIVSNLAQNTFTQIYKGSTKNFSLPCNHVTCIFKDEKDMMWVGTGKKGVSYASLNNISFDNKLLSAQEDVSCIIEDNGMLWLGFDGEGIARYDYKTKAYSFFKLKDKSIPSDLVVCSFKDAKGRVWWGSFGGGPFYYENGRFVSPTYNNPDNKIEPPYYIRRIAQDADGNLWFATYAKGLYRLDSKGNLLQFTMANSELKTNYIADISCTDGRILYIATSSGVLCLDTSTLKFMNITQNPEYKETIRSYFANCIYQDSRGLLWIGGRQGIHIYDKQHDELIHLSTDNGISHPYIRAIVEDQNKNMWITTDHGITHIAVSNKPPDHENRLHCYPYFEEDGIANFTFNNFSIYCNKRNEVLMGASGGYVQVDANVIEAKHYAHKVVFTEMYLANDRVEVSKSVADGHILLPKNIQLLDEITIDYSNRSFALEVSSMDYGNLHKLQYLYRLDGKDEWIELSGNRILFNKLASGTYHLEVKVKDHQDCDDNPISTLTIHVLPPFWLSVPAYIVYALLLILFILTYTFRLKRNHKRTLNLQKREMEVAQKHEIDEAKLRFFTNISHDLRTPLSLILIPLEKMLKSEKAAGLKDDLSLMHRNAVALLDTVNQLLDFRKIDTGNMQLHLSHGEITEYVREICHSFDSYGQNQSIQLRVDIQSNPIEMDFDKNKIQRVLMNLLSNAYKYNVSNGQVTLTLRKVTEQGNDFVKIDVADTGIGIKDENKPKIFERFFQEERTSTPYAGSGIGMHIVKEYVTLHGGTIQVSDNKPQGTVFTVLLPIQNNLSATAEEKTTPAESISTKSEGKSISLLIVEDNDDFRHFLVDSLKSLYTVFEAANGQQALNVLATNDIQMVISDVRMPVMDGLELCNKIKGDIRYSHIPVILLTAYITEEQKLEGLNEGADDYITKPFNMDILLLRIQKILQWTQNNHQQFKEKIDVSPAEITVSTLDERLIENAIRIVEENMDNSNFSVEDLSAQIGMSRGHLYKKMVSITGKTPIEFIRVLRIKRGKQLLEQSHDSISQIAYMIGLSPKQFAKYFKEEYGVLPSEYN